MQVNLYFWLEEGFMTYLKDWKNSVNDRKGFKNQEKTTDVIYWPRRHVLGSLLLVGEITGR